MPINIATKESFEGPSVEVVTVSDVLLFKDLRIPPYQRPYSWDADENVAPFINDLLSEFSSQRDEQFRYRLGTIIIHKDGSSNIVDGQQRLLTLSLIIKALLEKPENSTDDYLSLLKPDGIIEKETFVNINRNYFYIKQYLENLALDDTKREKIKDGILYKCDFFVITITNLDNAFQLFDSQNSRGKDLDPEDLLKAYHLRKMNSSSAKDKETCAMRWEQAISEQKLHHFMEDLYRIRKWAVGECNCYYFTKDEIDTFKGINPIELFEDNKYPYLIPIILYNYLGSFQIDEPIINGKHFFDYIDYFMEMSDSEMNNYYIGTPWEEPARSFINTNRAIDCRIQDFYFNLLLYYISRFGEDINYLSFKKSAFRMSFVHILSDRTLRIPGFISSLVNQVNDFKPFVIIKNWHQPDIIDFNSRISLPQGDFNYKDRTNRQINNQDEWNTYCNGK